MFRRPVFITNSSNTSLVAFGVRLDDEEFEKLGELPKEVDYTHSPYDGVYVHIGFPSISIDKDGILHFPPSDSMQESYLVLKKFLEDAGIESGIGYIEEGWYDG